MTDKVIDVWADRSKVGTIHMLKERRGGVILTKCGAKPKTIVEATVWWQQVNCPECRVLVAPKKLRLRKKR